MRHVLADHGLQVAELDPLLNWIPDLELGDGASEQGEAFFRASPEEFFRVGEALDAMAIGTALFTDQELELDRIAESFATLCDGAKEHGLLITLEFLPWSQIATLGDVVELVNLAGRDNGGVMFDTWHHFRSGGDLDSIRKHATKILGVQINDAPAEPEADLVQETMCRRRLPGDGDIDLAGYLNALRDGNCKAPIGAEVFSETLAQKPVQEIADATMAAMRKVIP